jgi:site-specific recombinase XerD
MNLPLINEFVLELINSNYSQRTVDSYKRDLEIFDVFLKYLEIEFDSLQKLDFAKYKEFLRNGEYIKQFRIQRYTNHQNVDYNKGLKKSSSNASKKHSMYSGRLGSRSVNRMLSTLRSYFKFLNDVDYKIPVSADSIKLVKTEKKVSQVAELNELIELIESPETLENDKRVIKRNRAMLELLFATGMRISELINLNRNDLKLDKDGFTIKDSRIFIRGKGNKERFVYLTQRCQNILENYLQSRKDNFPALFIPYRGTRIATKDPYIVRIAVNYLQAKIKEYREILGINVPTSAHSLRHGFATYLAEKGANPAAIQKLLGHESLQTTSKYVHSSDRFAQKSHEDYHPLNK